MRIVFEVQIGRLGRRICYLLQPEVEVELMGIQIDEKVWLTKMWQAVEGKKRKKI